MGSGLMGFGAGAVTGAALGELRKKPHELFIQPL